MMHETTSLKKNFKIMLILILKRIDTFSHSVDTQPLLLRPNRFPATLDVDKKGENQK